MFCMSNLDIDVNPTVVFDRLILDVYVNPMLGFESNAILQPQFNVWPVLEDYDLSTSGYGVILIFIYPKYNLYP